MVFSSKLLIMFLVAMAISAIGFKSYVWFFSIGYGLAIAAHGLTMLLMFKHDAATALLCVILLAYGLRLGGYLTYRELKMKTYLQTVGGDIKDSKTVPIFVKICIWLACGALYTTMVSPVFFRQFNGLGGSASTWIGMVVMLLGIGMEAAADWQKSQAKKVNSRRFVDTGLFRFVRCPNYLGELLLWTGVLITGIGGLQSVGQWVFALIGYAGIVYVMFSGARRLELRQNRNYGRDPEYQRYVKTVPIMIPFVPLYSVEKYKWLVA